MKEFDREDLEFYLKDEFKGLSKKYMIECIFNEEIQKKWKPRVGDVIVGPTGNIFVISGEHDLVKDLGGKMFMFGGSLCNRDGGSFMNSTQCYLMNKKGFKDERMNVYDVSSFKDFRYVPYPHELEHIEKINYE